MSTVTKRLAAMDRIRALADEVREQDATLHPAQAVAKVLATEAGARLYEVYKRGMDEGEPFEGAPEPEPVALAGAEAWAAIQREASEEFPDLDAPRGVSTFLGTAAGRAAYDRYLAARATAPGDRASGSRA